MELEAIILAYHSSLTTRMVADALFGELFLRTGQFDTLNESFLGKEKGDHNRHGEDCCGRHQLVPNHSTLTLKILQAERHSEILRTSQEE